MASTKAAAAAATTTTRGGAAQPTGGGGGGDKSGKKKKREKDNEAEEARKKREYEEQQAAWRSITWAEYKPDLRWPLETVSDDIDLAKDVLAAEKVDKKSKTTEIIVSPHGSLEFCFEKLIKKPEIWDGVEKQRRPHEKKVKVPLNVQRRAQQCIYSRIFSSLQHELGTVDGDEHDKFLAQQAKTFSKDEKILEAYKFADETLKARRCSKNWSLSLQLGTAYEATLMQDWQILFDSPRLRPHADKFITKIIPLCVQACDRIATRAQNENLINSSSNTDDKPYWNPIRSFAGYLLKHNHEATTSQSYGYHLYKFFRRMEERPRLASQVLEMEQKQQAEEEAENVRRVVDGSIEEGVAMFNEEEDKIEAEKSNFVEPHAPPPNSQPRDDFWTKKISMK